ncbi:tumor susceptibility gene 101 protein [Alosa sapidissima]|uniref:tumor susceptibility gene 101 protein n=1 Tax=Alosa sapidissima TaxID=34773 RepID=UPI001C07F92B|nr:tumor susceptibility gene 101 protein [Alosa sapidissima]
MSVTSTTLRKMLPKKYHHKKETIAEVIAALSQNKHLVPVMDKFVFNDGTTKTLLSLSGTIWMCYGDKGYNIPVSLWLDERYPRTAPICYVKPTCEMMILSGKHVNSNGEIQLPYLNEWRHTVCDLHTLIQVLSLTFGESPPVGLRLTKEESQSNCAAQQRHSNIYSTPEGYSFMLLRKDDGLSIQRENETCC